MHGCMHSIKKYNKKIIKNQNSQTTKKKKETSHQQKKPSKYNLAIPPSVTDLSACCNSACPRSQCSLIFYYISDTKEIHL